MTIRWSSRYKAMHHTPNRDKDFKALTRPPNSPYPNWIKHYRMCPNKTHPWRRHLARDGTQRIPRQMSQDALRGPVSTSWWARTQRDPQQDLQRSDLLDLLDCDVVMFTWSTCNCSKIRHQVYIHLNSSGHVKYAGKHREKHNSQSQLCLCCDL